MPIAEIPGTPAIPPAPEASSEDAVRERRANAETSRRRRRRPPKPAPPEQAREEDQEPGHIDIRA